MQLQLGGKFQRGLDKENFFDEMMHRGIYISTK